MRGTHKDGVMKDQTEGGGIISPKHDAQDSAIYFITAATCGF